jgi:hypothetical protein
MPAAETAKATGETFLQGTSGAPLEMFVRLDGPGEHHFYAQGLTVADLGGVFGAEIRPLHVLATRLPSEFLNPHYWEPLTREAENAVREKMTGLITRTEGDRVLLWRSDRIARSRLLRDGLEMPVDLLLGYIFSLSGQGLLDLGKGWAGRGRFEWAGLSQVPSGTPTPAFLNAVHTDLAQMKPSLREEAFLYSSQGDGLARVVFPREAQLHRAIAALVRGFILGTVKGHLASLSARVAGQIAGLADGVGLSAGPEDVLDKGRTVEVTLRLGRTPWGVTPRAGANALAGDEKILLYYDRISGLWAVSS